MDQSKVATVTTRRRHWSTTFSSSRTRTRRNETKIKTIIIKKKPVTPRLNRIPNIEKAHRPDEQKQSKRKRKKGGRMENKKNRKEDFCFVSFFFVLFGKNNGVRSLSPFRRASNSIGTLEIKRPLSSFPFAFDSAQNQSQIEKENHGRQPKQIDKRNRWLA